MPPLRSLFVDMNAYFASVEQAERPELRGRPIAVAPMEVDSTFIIAASVEAKRLGVKTGMMVGTAKQILPELVVVGARPPVYVHYHRRICAVLEDVLPIDKVCSIDEMRFCLIGQEREVEEAKKIAMQMKEALRSRVGPEIACSIGIAPNHFLAKLATDLQKPNGLVVIQGHELPDRLKGMKLTEFCGINRKMEIRLKSRGIFTSDDLVAASSKELHQAFGSIIGEKWWCLLRGEELPEDSDPQKSLGHSHVLPPELRTESGARDILLRLAYKAAARLRANRLEAGFMAVFVKGKTKSWSAKRRIPASNDSTTLADQVRSMWEERNFDAPQMVGVNFGALTPTGSSTPSLFEEAEGREKRVHLSEALDQMNNKFGKSSVFLASLEKVQSAAQEKIAFNKTWLFDEGKDDNAGVNFRGL